VAVASVTGAGRGIGRACALALAEAGFDLVLNDLTQADLSETARAVEALGRRVETAPGDIATDAARIGERLATVLGPLTAHVNNAGVPMRVRGDLLNVDADDYDRVLGVNTRGTFLLTQAVARRMVEDGAPAAGTRSIVTVTSASAVLASADRGPYCMAKAALAMMVKLFAVRLAEHAIQCHDVRPGVIRTPMTAPVAAHYDAMIADGLSPIARWGEDRDVAAAVVLLARGALPFSTGDAFHVDGGLHIHRL
jgi:NAD(P)-dependent dehydrogenase (short-subunit alcohol dehydrogenase family)